MNFVSRVIRGATRTSQVNVTCLVITASVRRESPINSSHFIRLARRANYLIVVNQVVSTIAVRGSGVVFRVLRLLVRYLRDLKVFVRIIRCGNHGVNIHHDERNGDVRVKGNDFSGRFLVDLVRRSFLQAGPMVVNFSQFRSIRSSFVLRVITSRLPVRSHADLLRILLVNSMFRPTVDQSNDLPRSHGSVSCEVLRVKLHARCLTHELVRSGVHSSQTIIKDNQLVPCAK